MQFLRLGPVGGEIPAVRTAIALSTASRRSRLISLADSSKPTAWPGPGSRWEKAASPGSVTLATVHPCALALRLPGQPLLYASDRTTRPTHGSPVANRHLFPSCSSNTPTPLSGHTTRYPSRRAAPRPIGRLNWPSSSHGARGTWRRPQQLLATPPGTQPPTTSPSGPISLSSPTASGPRENATRRSPRWAPCSSQPTRSLTRKNSDCQQLWRPETAIQK